MKYQNIFFATAAILIAGCTDDSKPVSIRPLPGACSLDVPASGASLSKGKAFRVEGWAFNTLAQTVPSEIEIIFTTQDGRSNKAVKLERNLKRADVAAAYKNPALEAAGYSGEVNLSDLPEGSYGVAISQKNDNTLLFCQTPSTILLGK